MYPVSVKTTFDLPESLIDDVKRIAKSRGTTARDVVWQALTRAVDEDGAAQPFVLADKSVPGVPTDLAVNADWAELRALAYGDRGGHDVSEAP